MKTAYLGLAWLLVAALAFSAAALIDVMPVANEGYAAKAFESWSGVVKIYCGKGWKPGNGSFAPWLKKAASRFEKRHPGVRVQVETVDGEELRAFASEENPPDVILFSPGELSCESLAELDRQHSIRESLASCGQSQNTTFALPVAMGVYAWALNTSLVDKVPNDWSELDDLKPIKSQKRFIMDAPADSEYNCWSGALCALMSPTRIYIEGNGVESFEIDAGLPDGSPLPTVEPISEIVINRLPKTLSTDFRTRASVYGAFASGLVGAIPATQYEIRSLSRLSQSGKGFSWAVEPGGGAFTDQLLMAAAPKVERKDAEARLSIAKEFIYHLLTDESQRELASVRAFSVTDIKDMYAGQYGMARLESIASGVISFPSAFDGSFRESMKREADRLINPE